MNDKEKVKLLLIVSLSVGLQIYYMFRLYQNTYSSISVSASGLTYLLLLTVIYHRFDITELFILTKKSTTGASKYLFKPGASKYLFKPGISYFLILIIFGFAIYYILIEKTLIDDPFKLAISIAFSSGGFGAATAFSIQFYKKNQSF